MVGAKIIVKNQLAPRIKLTVFAAGNTVEFFVSVAFAAVRTYPCAAFVKVNFRSRWVAVVCVGAWLDISSNGHCRTLQIAVAYAAECSHP